MKAVSHGAIRKNQANDRLTLVALSCGVAVPFLYYGAQLVAAPFYPGYSVIRQAASMLGSDLTVYPWIFNTIAFLTGIAAIIAAVGFLRAFQRLGVTPIVAWITSLAVAVNGIVSIKAGYYPLPDPRHAAGPLLIGMLVVPALLCVALWRQRDARAIKSYLVLTNLLILIMIPIMSGMTSIDMRSYDGLIQRIATLAFFPPIGVSAFFLLQRIKQRIR